ncbi:hypothetical protein [Neoactinobaculum massilliense]|uniref:restriction system modified-DNA reader domain-containing protein n=1 Tax=Neoactinobaculum massilliense TaxID=2364794 RepID=UPI000F5233F4|nr:hypothetical protein [Neoactinobaculum massilliense]
MAVFSIRNGDIGPAPWRSNVADDVAESVLTTLHSRAVDLISTPLFAVAYVDDAPGERAPLVALDGSGQVVTVEVVRNLTSTGLLAGLTRAGSHVRYSRDRVEKLYAGDFEANWKRFSAQNSPVARAGARLYVMTLAVAPDAVPVVEALAGAGVEVRVARLIDGVGETIVSLENVGVQVAPAVRGGVSLPVISDDAARPAVASLAQTEEPAPVAGSVVGENTDRQAEEFAPVAGPGDEVTPEEAGVTAVLPADTDAVASARGEDTADAASGRTAALGHTAVADDADVDVPALRDSSLRRRVHGADELASDALHTVAETAEHEAVAAEKAEVGKEVADTSESPAAGAPREGAAHAGEFVPAWLPVDSAAVSGRHHAGGIRRFLDTMQRSARGRHGTAPVLSLGATAARAGAPVQIRLRFRRRGVDETATLTVDGRILLPDGREFTDPSQAVEAITGVKNVDGWRAWRTVDGRALRDL